MRFNIFRNPYIDAQAGMLVDSFEQAIRNQSEFYWRYVIRKEILDIIYSIQYDGDYCKMIHSCDLIEEINKITK